MNSNGNLKAGCLVGLVKLVHRQGCNRLTVYDYMEQILVHWIVPETYGVYVSVRYYLQITITLLYSITYKTKAGRATLVKN